MTEVIEARRSLAAALSAGDSTAIKKARQLLDEARRKAEESELLAEAMVEREQATEAARKAAAIAESWRKVRNLADKRGELVEQIESRIAELGPMVSLLSEIQRDILATVPVAIDVDRAELKSGVESARETFWLHGLVAGSPWSPWEMAKRPTMAERFSSANDYLKGVAK